MQRSLQANHPYVRISKREIRLKVKLGRLLRVGRKVIAKKGKIEEVLVRWGPYWRLEKRGRR